MTGLVEEILNNDLVSAQDIFESKMYTIVEQKLYERKRLLSAQLYETVEVQPDPEGRVRGGEKKASEDEEGSQISRRTREKIEQLRKSKSGFRGLAADVLARAERAKAKLIKKKPKAPATPPRDPSAISPKKPSEVTGNAPSTMWSRVKAHTKDALERHDAETAQKSAWERSVGGKTAKVAKPVLKGIGQVVAGMMQGAE